MNIAIATLGWFYVAMTVVTFVKLTWYAFRIQLCPPMTRKQRLITIASVIPATISWPFEWLKYLWEEL